MTQTLDDIRTSGEAKLLAILKDADAEVRRLLMQALRQYQSVDRIPQSVWDRVKEHYADNERLTAALFLLFVAGDEWTADRIGELGVNQFYRVPAGEYLDNAAANTQTLAGTVDTLRNRLARRIQDSRLTGPGGLGELTEDGIDEALDDVLTDSRIETIATDQTTQAITGGQRGASERVAGDGAATVDGKATTIALIWRTERDNLVCPRCAPLEGQPEEVWSLVFPEGPGPDAHPRCRCQLEPTIVSVASEQ